MALLVQDSFTEAAGTPDLNTHLPDVGTGWTRQEQDNTTVVIEVMSTSDRASPSGTDADSRLLYSSQPNPTIADVDVEITASIVAGTNATPWGLFARWQDNNNYYVFQTYRSADGAQPRVLKKIAGVYATLATGTSGRTATGDRYKLSLRGSLITVYQDTGSGYVQIYSVTDTVIAGAGRAGLSVGRHDVTTDDINTNWQWDDYVLTEFPSGGTDILDPFGMSGIFGQ